MARLREALGATRCAGLDDAQVMDLAEDDLAAYRKLQLSVNRAYGVMGLWWSQTEIDRLFEGEQPVVAKTTGTAEVNTLALPGRA